MLNNILHNRCNRISFTEETQTLKFSYMKTFDVPNYRVIKATFVPATNSRGSRVKLYETTRYSDQKTDSKIFSYDYSMDGVLDQALDILDRNGWNVVGRGSEDNNYFIFCNNWGEDFKQIKDLK